MAAFLAVAVVVLYLGFVLFVTLGALAVWKRPRLAYLHLPAIAWAVWIEASGGVCPLTPLENHWRAQAGLEPYRGDFIAEWIFPLLYPDGLTRETQLALAAAVLLLNVALYARLLGRRCYTRLFPGRPGSSVGRAHD